MSPFAQTIGHKTAQDVLLRLFAGDRAPHALLMVGPSHVGKTHLFMQLVHHLYQSDRSIESFADVTILKRERDPKTEKKKSQISVKQVRALTERLAMSPLAGGWKVAFVEEAGRLSTGAANALLKTLEEPKGKTLIVLRAPSVQSVLPTIASRCQLIRLSVVSREQIASALIKRGLSKVEAEEIAARSLGRPGLALRLVKDSELRAQKDLARHQAQTLFHRSRCEQFRTVTELIPKGETDKARVLAQLLDEWSEALRDELLWSIGCGQWASNAKASEVPTQKVTRLLERLQEVRGALSHNINPHLALEHLFL